MLCFSLLRVHFCLISFYEFFFNLQGFGVVLISLFILAKDLQLPPELRGFIFYAQVRKEYIIHGNIFYKIYDVWNVARKTAVTKCIIYKYYIFSHATFLCLLQVIGLVFGPFSNVINTRLKVSLSLIIYRSDSKHLSFFSGHCLQLVLVVIF